MIAYLWLKKLDLYSLMKKLGKTKCRSWSNRSLSLHFCHKMFTYRKYIRDGSVEERRVKYFTCCLMRFGIPSCSDLRTIEALLVVSWILTSKTSSRVLTLDPYHIYQTSLYIRVCVCIFVFLTYNKKESK